MHPALAFDAFQDQLADAQRADQWCQQAGQLLGRAELRRDDVGRMALGVVAASYTTYSNVYPRGSVAAGNDDRATYCAADSFKHLSKHDQTR